jgi:hypothetical protein
MIDDNQPEDPAGDLDLSAWQPPPPPPRFADGVVSRARVPDRMPWPPGRSVPVVAVSALIVAVLALVGEVALHGTRLFVGDEDARADIERLDAQVRALRGEVAGLQDRAVAAQPVTVPAPAQEPPPEPAPVPAPPPPMPVPVDPLPASIAPGDTGTVSVTCAQPAAVYIDGRRVGNTPWTGAIAVGGHKVTYGLGADRYSFRVDVKKGETATLAKDFGL